MKIDTETIKKLKEHYGDAFYLLDSRQFRENFVELKSAFSAVYKNFNIAYSYKTNYTPKLCSIINELGGYAEVVSEMEMRLALECGVPYHRIIWNGPIKNREELRRFLLSGGTSNIDNINETMFIKQLAEENSEIRINVGIRCNYEVGDGVISRFGFDIDGDDFKETVKIVQATDNIHFVNFQCHFAKRQIDYWPTRAKGMVDLLRKIDIVPERIDIGGGLFGKMPDELKEQFTCAIPSYMDYAKEAATILADYFKEIGETPELLIEPGSALVGDCMRFVGTIQDIKNVRGKYYATMLGSQKNISMTGVNPPIEVIKLNQDADYYKDLDIVGFTCIEGDVIYRDYSGYLSVGDVVVVSNCGSYSLVMKPPFILPNFPVIDISEGNEEVIKRAETFDDIFHTFNIK